MTHSLFWRSLLLSGLFLASAGAVQTPRRRVPARPAVPAAPATAPTPPPPRAADRITAEELRSHVEFLASDELEGRDTPSRGLDTAAKFLAHHAGRWGLKPAGDNGTFFQRIALRRERVLPDQSTGSFAGRTLRAGVDFLITASGFPPSASPGTAEGPLVYAGHGWMVKAKGLDPYAELDVKGKILLLHTPTGFGPPKGIEQADLSGMKGQDWDDPQGSAQRLGAVGIAWLPRFTTLANWDRSTGLGTRARTVVQRFSPAGGLPAITLSAGLQQSLLQGEKLNAEEAFSRVIGADPAASFALSAQKVLKFTVAAQTEELATNNVVAILEGSDPQLKNEYVALGAHYDHVGVREGQEGDRIFNGADDDASGTAALLAIAETVARGPRPKRSLLFVWHAGEEKGLWGSRYFTESPTVPLGQIVAQLNIDMIGRSKADGDTNPRNANLSGPNHIYVIGSKMMSDDLGALSEQVNSSYLKLEFDYRYDDPKDPNRFFFRSDHINYARKGIPIIFYFDGVHEDYHRVSDHADRLDYRKLERVTRTICATAVAIGNAALRPAVVRPLPQEFQQNRPGRAR
ncbi:MAG: M20/M25/M40 family metallo-hydrolase [Armatimonadetes bacterium]|nr:M20/M25/M40 family metallo-hydrolase [Armatimonadota bacterium]